MGSAVEQKILKSALDTFLRYGFHGTKLQQIAVNANVSKSMIHYYFRSKERLYKRVLENVIEYIENGNFMRLNFERKNLKVKWFLYTELYNNQTLFEIALEEIYHANWDKKRDGIIDLFNLHEAF